MKIAELKARLVKAEQAAEIWRVVNNLRTSDNWQGLELLAQRLDAVAVQLTKESGTDYTDIVEEFELGD